MSDYAKYSSLGIQMVLFILVCLFIGKFLDKQKWLEFPVFTVSGIFTGAFGAMYYLIKTLK